MNQEGYKPVKSKGYKLAKGIMLGGFGSIIAVDLAELCFCALDPVTSKGIEYYDIKVKGVAPRVGASSQSEEEIEKNRKNIWKRVFRITLLLIIAFLAFTFLF